MLSVSRRLPLKLVRSTPVPSIAGVVLPRRSAPDLLSRLEKRRQHYRTLRIVMTPTDVVLLSPNNDDLPWSDAVRFYLRQQGAALLPIDWRLNVPAHYHDEVVSRLAAAMRQALPLLILPGDTDAGGALQVTGLSQARSLRDVDIASLAMEWAS